MPKHEIRTIQMLRGVAASLVVLYHSQHYLSLRNHIPNVDPIYNFGRSGVDIFFIVSGFIMVYITWDNFQKPRASIDFLIRRAIRIVPLYWFYSFVISALLLFFPKYFGNGKEFDIAHVSASFLFIPWENTVGGMNPVLPVGWTLNFEVYFYLVFSLCLLMKRDRFTVPLLIFLLGGVAMGRVVSPDAPVFRVMTSPMLVEFVMGCIIGMWYKQGKLIPIWLCAALIVLSLSLALVGISIDHPVNSRVIFWGVPAALLVAGLVFVEKQTFVKTPAILVSLGDSSYSLYLTHLFSVHLVGLLWMKYIGSNLYLFTFVAFVFSVMVGYASLIMLERPATKIFTALYRDKWKYILQKTS